MVGVQHVKISNERVIFEFDLYRKVTIIRGDSATGKTTLYDLVAQHNREAGNPSKLVVQSTKKCHAFAWAASSTLENLTDSIIFIDEQSVQKRNHKRLAKMISNSDNYFVIISRDDIKTIPYSITEIYRIKKSNRYISLGKVYNQLDRIYKVEDRNNIGKDKKDVVITEDGGSGFEMFSKVLPACKVEAASGKSNIVNKLDAHDNEEVAVIADGAALGPEMGALMRRIDVEKGKVVLYAPESFEWLLLNLKMFRGALDKIQNTAEYADSSSYETWEQYYLELLKEELSKRGISYTKSHMPRQMINQRTLDEFRSILPDIFE